MTRPNWDGESLEVSWLKFPWLRKHNVPDLFRFVQPDQGHGCHGDPRHSETLSCECRVVQIVDIFLWVPSVAKPHSSGTIVLGWPGRLNADLVRSEMLRFEMIKDTHKIFLRYD